MHGIKIGWSEVDITPKKGVKIGLDGQFYDRITDEVESKITVTAFALESNDEQLIICSCDLVCIAQNLNYLVKDLLKDKLSISPDKVIINAIHTHTSYLYHQERRLPKTMNYLKTVLPKDMEYVNEEQTEKMLDPDEALLFLANKIVEAVVKAWDNRDYGFYMPAFGRAAIGMCRRVVYDDNTAKMWGETNLANFKEMENGSDSGIELLYAFDKNKNLTGIIANICCPAQIVEQRSFISSDFWGKAKENIRKYFGKNIMLLALCGAAGDQCPRDLIRWVEPETPIKDPNVKHLYPLERRGDPSMFDISGLKVVGRRISNEIISVYEELDLSGLKGEGELEHRTIDMFFPLRTVTLSEYEEAKNKIDSFIKTHRGQRVNYEDNAKLYVYSGIVDRYHTQQKINGFKEEIHIVRFDDMAFMSCPFELFLNFGNIIKARSKAKQTFIIQLANGAGGYLPTEIAEIHGHYSAYVSSGTTGHEGGDILVRETLDNIKEMFEK